jgi:hypothetical protein
MKFLKIAAGITYILSAAWICIFQTSNVFGNLEASYIWACPAAVLALLAHNKLRTIHADVKKHNKENHDD